MRTKILIVDDLKENILALSKLIEGDDVEILTADNPDDALNLILDHDFGLALFDVQMPIMTGFELARLVRGVDRGRHLPIIFVTAQSQESRTIFEGYESGAVDVLFKPLDPHIVRSKVRVFVRLDQQSRLLASQVEAMAKLKQEADAANVAKSQFLANMSHEIRTPLSAVLGFADILSQGGLSAPERLESIASISRNGKLLLRIIDDILDLSRIEAQRLELEKTVFDIDELLRDLEVTLSAKAAEKGIELKFERGAGFGGRFISDPLRIKQILLNMVGNAIKFTHRGSVVITAETSEVPTLTRSLRSLFDLKFTIKDTGIGLAADEADKLFVAFSQADTSTRRKYGGTGLGLVISKQLARSMGGDVILQSTELGKGSEFLVTIRALASDAREENLTRATEGVVRTANQTPSPLARSQEQKESRPVSSAAAPGTEGASVQDQLSRLRGKRVLVVDDVPDNRTLIERYLRPVGIEVDTAQGGAEALELASRSDWDLVLMDIQMPNMDGYETTSNLRKLGFHKPIIALTAHAMREELDRCLRAGCDDTMTKPVAKRDLIRRLSEVLQ